MFTIKPDTSVPRKEGQGNFFVGPWGFVLSSNRTKGKVRLNISSVFFVFWFFFLLILFTFLCLVLACLNTNKTLYYPSDHKFWGYICTVAYIFCYVYLENCQKEDSVSIRLRKPHHCEVNSPLWINQVFIAVYSAFRKFLHPFASCSRFFHEFLTLLKVNLK